MKTHLLLVLSLAASLVISSTIQAQTPPATTQAELAHQLSEARQQLAEQAALLRDLSAQLARQGQAIEQLRARQTSVQPAPALAGSAEDGARLQNAAVSLRSDVPASATVAAPLPAPAAKNASATSDELSFRLGHAKFTPGGWFDLTALYRSTATGNGLNTAFAAIPYNNTVQGGLSEFRMSSQASRLTMRIDENIGRAKLFGYAEADFIGTQPGNAYVSTNSNTFRMRVFYANLFYGKWELLGGQAWSLLTPTRKAISPYVTDLFISIHSDNGYQAGLTYGRQPQVRLVYHATPSLTAALSLENPEQFSGSTVTFPTLFSNMQTDTNSTSSGGGTTTPNLHPDLIAKVAYDRLVFGRFWHMGTTGLLTPVRIVTPASVTKASEVKDTREGGGIAADFNFEIAKGLRLIATGYWSDGGGRYIGGLAPGFVVLQNGTAASPFSAALIHSGSGIGGFEWNANKKTTFSFLGSAVYAQRRYGLDPKASTPTYIGYGFPGSSNAQNRIIKELSFGTKSVLWQDPAYGALHLITQSSYVLRAPWYVAPGAPKNAHTMMEFVSMRYIIP